jgi:segregation and condensation protein B
MTMSDLETNMQTPDESELAINSPSEEPERTVVFEEALEAILFAAGHPVSYATLARVFEMTPQRIKDRVFEYALKYNDTDIPRGVILITYSDSCQLCTKKYYLNEIRETLGIKKSGTLSTSSLEALAIVAYNQPVTRSFVDTLRRADSSYAMNNLIDRGLIESKGRLDAPGRPMLYGTTQDFLRSFGINDLSALPNTSEELDALFSRAKKSDSDVLPDQQAIDFGLAEKGEVTDGGEEKQDGDFILDLDDEVSAEDDIISEE